MVADPVLTFNLDTPSLAAAAGYLVLDDPVYGLLDTGKLAPDEVWNDCSGDVRNLTISRGMSSFDGMLFVSESGKLTATLDNRARTYDSVLHSDIKPGVPVEVKFVYNSVTYTLFTGTVDDWPLEYPAYAKDAIVQLSANDGWPQLSSLDINETATSELTGARVSRIANMVGWPGSRRNISPGQTTMPSSAQTISALSALQEAAASELGELNVSAEGYLVFRDHDAIMTETRSTTSQGTFGDQGGELRYSSIEAIPNNQKSIRNQITLVYNVAGDAVTASDGTSIDTYGTQAETLTVRMADATEAGRHASFLLNLFANPRPRFASITVKPFRDPTNLFPQVFGRKLGDRITVKFTPTTGARISRECFIRGIHHNFAATRDMQTTFVLQDATAWPTAFILDSSLLNSTDVLL